MRRHYSNNKITVFWDSDKCIGAGKCDVQLPRVFDPKRRPWVNLDAADAEVIKSVIDNCPSGALGYRIPGEKKSKAVTIKMIKDGPYKVTGKCRLINKRGEDVDTGDVFALCRCGASRAMPLCDGSHHRIGFRDKKPTPLAISALV